jgi:hypothetical protein
MQPNASRQVALIAASFAVVLDGNKPLLLAMRQKRAVTVNTRYRLKFLRVTIQTVTVSFTVTQGYSYPLN